MSTSIFNRSTIMAKVVLALSVCFALVLTTSAQSPGAAITTNYQEADIREIVNAVSEITGQTFIIDPRVKAQVTMVSSSPMTADAFYEAFLSILDVYGFVAVESGDIIKIVPNTNARQMPTANYEAGGRHPSDEMITHVVQVKNVAAAQLVPILRPLIPQYGHLAAHPSSNMLIISDRAANVNRLLKIVGRIDQSSDSDIEVIPLQHASAGELAQVLTSMNQVARGDAAAASPFSVVADDRTNSLILGGDKSTRLRFRALIAHLDTPLEEGGNTQVVYLRYADAEELAGKLKEQASQTQQGTTGNLGKVTIWADQSTNALVITAPPKVMRSLKSVIDQLDIRRAQVKIETLIADISEDTAINLGVSWAAFGSGGDDAIGIIDPSGTLQPVLGSVVAGAEGTVALPDISFVLVKLKMVAPVL
ncbi:MAG: hypothetical protein HKM24_00935 [Gammaproteobacteria bacterium]|nr:hypothetical protein [Gammaproteobacteria bacterium]